MSDNIVCPACNDTGLDSSGGLCHPCRVKGRQPVRDAVLRAVAGVFNRRLTSGSAEHDVLSGYSLPKEEELVEAVRWAFKPHVTYAIGYPLENGGVDIIFGPNPAMNTMLEWNGYPVNNRPDGGLKGFGLDKKLYIVKFTKTTIYSIPLIEPVARWKDGHWQMKPGGKR